MYLLGLLLLPLILLAQRDPLAEQAQQARQAMTDGRFQEAAALYEKLAASLPENAGLRMNVGLALHSAGDYAGAVRSFEEAVKRDPRLAPAWLLLGVGYQKLGQPRKAVAPLEKALQLEPQNGAARLELADAYFATSQFERAALHFRKVVDADPKSAKGWLGLGLSYRSLSQKAFRALEASAPESAYWYALLGRSRLEQQQYRAAFALFHKALESNRILREAHGALAEIYDRTGHPEWAKVEAQKERELPAPKCAAAALECAFSRGDFADVAAAKPDTPEALYWQARSYSALAFEAFSKIAALPDCLEIHALQAEAHQLAGRHTEAVSEWREAVRQAPRDPRLQKGLARALVAARDYEAAKPLLKRLLEQEPSSPELSLQFGRVLFEEQMGEQALPYVQKAAMDDPEAKALLGRLLLQLGRPAEAIPHLVAALPTDSDGSLHYQLAMAYRRTGREEQAKQAIQEQQKITDAQTRQAIAEKEITPP